MIGVMDLYSHLLLAGLAMTFYHQNFDCRNEGGNGLVIHTAWVLKNISIFALDGVVQWVQDVL